MLETALAELFEGLDQTCKSESRPPWVLRTPVKAHLVVNVELVDVTPLHHNLHDGCHHIHLHALQLTCLVVAAVIGVEGQVTQATHPSLGLVPCHTTWAASTHTNVNLNAGRYLKAATGWNDASVSM